MIGAEYNLVIPRLSKKQRNLFVLGGFFIGVGLIVLIYFITDIIIPILWFAIAYGLILMALSSSLLQINKIGTVTFHEDHVFLQNPEMAMERRVDITDIKNTFARKGLATNMVIAVKRKTLIIDLITNQNEPISMQIEVKESDIKTTDHLEKYFRDNNIPFSRKI